LILKDFRANSSLCSLSEQTESSELDAGPQQEASGEEKIGLAAALGGIAQALILKVNEVLFCDAVL
jgi:hypothetical protein